MELETIFKRYKEYQKIVQEAGYHKYTNTSDIESLKSISYDHYEKGTKGKFLIHITSECVGEGDSWHYVKCDKFEYRNAKISDIVLGEEELTLDTIVAFEFNKKVTDAKIKYGKDLQDAYNSVEAIKTKSKKYIQTTKDLDVEGQKYYIKNGYFKDEEW